MTTLRFKHKLFGQTRVCDMYPETSEWIRRNVPLGSTFELKYDEDHTSPQHRWFFAIVKKVWENLPEGEIFRNPEHLRKHALIHAGWCRSFIIESSITDTACRLAQWFDEYCLVSVGTGRDGTIVIYQAKSMRFKKNGGEMTKEIFSEVADRTLAYMAGLIGVDPAQLLIEVPRDFQ